jgi:hypothetical protein
VVVESPQIEQGLVHVEHDGAGHGAPISWLLRPTLRDCSRECSEAGGVRPQWTRGLGSVTSLKVEGIRVVQRAGGRDDPDASHQRRVPGALVREMCGGAIDAVTCCLNCGHGVTPNQVVQSAELANLPAT